MASNEVPHLEMTDNLDSHSPDSALRVFTGYILRRVVSAANPGVSAVLAELGLRRLLFSVLTVITENPGLKQSDLADALAIERPNMVKLVDELEGAGLITRERSTTDHRAKSLVPTPAGMKLQSQAFLRVVNFDRSLTKGLSTDDLDTLRRILKVIEANATASET